MALSPAKRHLARVRAAKESARTPHGGMMEGSGAFEQAMLQLQSDRARLKQIQSTEAKVALKLDMIEHYQPYVAGVLEAGQGAEDPVITEMLVWNLDVGRFDDALEIGRYVLQHRMPMPDRFSRTTGCVIAEEVAEAALDAQRLGQPFDLRHLTAVAELTAEQDMPDEVRAKLHLAAGRSLLAGVHDTDPTSEQVEEAVAHLRRAIELHGSCGAKKDLERAERLLKKLTSPPPAAG